jgi:hypothetical protein
MFQDLQRQAERDGMKRMAAACAAADYAFRWAIALELLAAVACIVYKVFWL